MASNSNQSAANAGMVVSINDIYNVDEINNAIDTLRGIVPQIFAEIRSNVEYKEWRILRNKGYNYFEETTSDEMIESDDYEVNTLINSKVTDYISNARNLFVRINGDDYRVIQILKFDKLPMWQIWECLFNEDEKWDCLVSDVWFFIHDLRDND